MFQSSLKKLFSGFLEIPGHKIAIHTFFLSKVQYYDRQIDSNYVNFQDIFFSEIIKPNQITTQDFFPFILSLNFQKGSSHLFIHSFNRPRKAMVICSSSYREKSEKYGLKEKVSNQRQITYKSRIKKICDAESLIKTIRYDMM